MIDTIQAAAIGVGVVLLVVVLELVRRRLLSEEYSIVWLLAALVLLGLAIGRHQLDRIASSLGINHPPALLILLVILVVFVVSLYFTLAISRQRAQIERLIEEVTVLSALQREDAAYRGAGAAAPAPHEAGDVRARATGDEDAHGSPAAPRRRP